MRRVALGTLIACVTLGAAPARAMPGGEDGRAVQRARAAITELRLEDAAEMLEPVVGRHPDDADVLYVQALLRFHEGDYGGALRSLESSLSQTPDEGEADERDDLRDLVAATHQTTEHFVETRSDDGRFVVAHAPGRDEVLVPHALEALEAADRALSDDLGMRVPGPIRLEIYPTPSSLASVSTLSVQAIERTGTIALCKWDRLMVTSPRALVRGYPWVDTIGHEYVHLVLSRASNDKAPVWFQEGVAKFLERRWRGEPPEAQLDPSVDALLREAAYDGELIPFDDLHPSIALLPSQKDAALAFAQVATFFESYQQEHGADALRAAIERVADGMDPREALAKVAGSSWSELEASWKRGLRKRPEPEDPPRLLTMRFRHGDNPDESVDVEQERARRHVRLGDLLWDHGRPGAAKVEYGKAHDTASDDPIVSSRLARAALASGDAGRAIEAIESVVRRHPDHAPARSVMASAQLAEGNSSEARRQAREAIRLNPFDPEPHCVLATAGKTDTERARAERSCTRLGGSPR